MDTKPAKIYSSIGIQTNPQKSNYCKLIYCELSQHDYICEIILSNAEIESRPANTFHEIEYNDHFRDACERLYDYFFYSDYNVALTKRTPYEYKFRCYDEQINFKQVLIAIKRI